MKSKTDIIHETVSYYEADPPGRRALYRGSIYYITPKGKMCPFGRCEISPSSKCKLVIDERFWNDEENYLEQDAKEQERRDTALRVESRSSLEFLD